MTILKSESTRLLDAQMMRTISDDAAWAETTATADGLDAAQRWLTETLAGIDQQISQRETELALEELDQDPQALREHRRAYLRWRKQALFLKGLCEKRRRDLRHLRTEQDDRSRQLFVALRTLADAVLRHERGEISDHQLHAHLDEISVPPQPAWDPQPLRETAERHLDRGAA